LVEMKQHFMNSKLSSLAKNERELLEFVIAENEIVRMRDPILTLPESKYGRAHFFAPYKRIAGTYIDTFWFNLLIIWLFTGFWFAVLYLDLLRKLIRYFESSQLQRFNRRIMRVLKQHE